MNNTITIQTSPNLGIDIAEFSVISEKFQINNTITIQTIRSLGIDIKDF